MYADYNEYVKVSRNEIERFTIRRLDYSDIQQIALARVKQEKETKNEVTKEYISKYQNVIKKLFDSNRIISAGAFQANQLVSLAFFNLISFGNKRKTPYLCGVWTDPQYRGKGLASQVYKKLLEGAYERKEALQTNTLLTIEGNKAALNLYKKLGYKFVNDEMVFLGDVEPPNRNFETQRIENDPIRAKEIYLNNGINKMQIEYSIEQFFPHPTNIDGKMYRIIGITLFDKDITYEDLKIYMQDFFSKHRFCKFNVKELMRQEGLERLLTSDENLTNTFEDIGFTDKNGQKINIKKANNIMCNDIAREFKDLEEKHTIDR